MSLKSWDCEGCINTEFRICDDGEIAEYCKPMIYDNGKGVKWFGDFVDCLDKIVGESYE